MTVRQRYFWSTALIGALLIVTAAVVSATGEIGFLLIPFILLPFYGLFQFTLRCKHCGEFIGRKKTRFGGIEFWTWGFTAPKHCSRCGAMIT
jgi:hypothetical protein